MKRAAAVFVGFACPFVGIAIDHWLLQDESLFSLPLTGFMALLTGLGYWMYKGFVEGARYATPSLFTESHRLTRFAEQPTIVRTNDGMAWAVLKVGGFEYPKAFLHSKNFNLNRGHIVVMPAQLLETMGSRFYLGEVQLVELEGPAIDELSRLLPFDNVFASLENKPTKLYMGIGSRTAHSDSEHYKRADVEHIGKQLAMSTEELGRKVRDLDKKLNEDLAKLDTSRTRRDTARMTAAWKAEKEREAE